MPNLTNLVVGPLLILALQIVKYAGYLFIGPDTALVNATVDLTARASDLHTHILFGWKWGFMMAQGGVLLWMLISSQKEEPYEQGYGY